MLRSASICSQFYEVLGGNIDFHVQAYEQPCRFFGKSTFSKANFYKINTGRNISHVTRVHYFRVERLAPVANLIKHTWIII